MRVFSDIKVRNGPDINGLYTITRVPIVYGDPSWVVAQAIKGNSENTLMPAPMFSAYIDSIKMSPERRQDTMFVGKVSTMERGFNNQTQTYDQASGVRYDVDRYMPVPYDLYLKLDCWTTNTTNKLQIMEQINTVFNPSIQLQQNSNILDWTSIFEVFMEDFVWTNRNIPQGSEAERDVMSWKFRVPIWINPPAKVKKSGLIAEIVANVFNVSDMSGLEATLDGSYDAMRSIFEDIPVQLITTEGNYKISVGRVDGQDEIILLGAGGQIDENLIWADLINKYGQISADITKIRLKLDPDIDVSDSDVIGGIVQDETRPNVLIFTPDVDTLPRVTLSPITEIIDPTEITPGNGLPAAVAGQRYLLTSANSAGDEFAIPPGVSSSPWGANIVAYPNDIIEYNGIYWSTVFDSKNTAGLNHVVNNSNSSQYTFDGVNWSYTYYGQFAPGYWRIDNIVQAADGLTVNVYE